MSRYGGNDNYGFETDIQIDVDVDLDLYSDVDVYYSSDINIDANVDVDVNINGNLASFNVDVEAIGDNSSAELNLAVLTTDGASMISASGFAAVD